MDTIVHPSPPSTLTRAIVISRITVHIPERLKYPLLVKLGIDGTYSRSVLLKVEENQISSHSLRDPLYLQEGAILSVQVLKKRRVLADQTLTQLNLSLEKLSAVQGPTTPEGSYKKYLVDLPDPGQGIWLNFTEVPSALQTNSNEVDDNMPLAAPTFADPQKAAKALKDATQSLQEFKTAFEHLDGAKLEEGVKVTEALGKLHSTALAVVKLVNIAYEEIKTGDQHHKAMLDLAESMEAALKLIPAAEDVVKLNVLKDTIQSFYELMNRTVDFIKKWLADAVISKIVDDFQSQSEVESLKKEYNTFEKALGLGVAVDNAVKVGNVTKSQELEELEAALGGIKEINPRADPCMEGTRTHILSEVNSKIECENIVWIYGAPGSGKSAVSLTIKSLLHKQGRLLAYFRFDRNDATVTTSKALWCHVAYELAKRYPSVLKHNLSLLRENKVNLTSTIEVFESLVEEPLSKLSGVQSSIPLIVVIDALDECGGLKGRLSSDREALLETLGHCPKLPNLFKLLVTSREESDIERVLSGISARVNIPSGHSLTENPQAEASVEASNDIHMFLEYRFQRIRERLPSLPRDWPGTETVAKMTRRAGGIFMWATTATRFINSGIDPRGRLHKIMDDVSESSSMKPLYALYATILEMSFGGISGGSEAEVLRSVLGAMVLAKRPLRDTEFIELPTAKAVTLIMLDSIRDSLRSVVASGELRFIHKSFDDFLLSKECPSTYAIRADESQYLLTKLCMTTMTEKLRFNICDLETSCLRNEDIPHIDTKIQDGISSLLSYSCCFWASHLVRTPFNEQLLSTVKDMIFDKLLYWFEVMSLLKEVNQVAHSLLSVLGWSSVSSDPVFNHFIRDAYRFISAFCYPISQSAPHIYISALPFAPQHSAVVNHFLPWFPGVLAVSVGKPTDWSPCISTLEHHRFWVRSVAFLPDEKYFISGSVDAIVCVCESGTGNLVVRQQIPSRSSTSFLSFDPSGQRVWVCCDDGQVIGSNIETGDEHLVFQAGTGDIYDLIDCCYFDGGRNLISVSHQKGVVTLWNADTGERMHDILKLPSDTKYPLVAFSPDGCYMAWADQSDLDIPIRIWNLMDGSKITRLYHPRPHFSTLSFSVDGHFVVSGCWDGIIIIWDAKTGDIVCRPLNATGEKRVEAVAYSHENRILVSASGDPGTLTVWNTLTREVLLGPLEGHTSSISAIALSRDGQRALSASRDKTLRMWDLGGKGVMPVTANDTNDEDQVLCIAFSRCGERLASLTNSTVRIWNVNAVEVPLQVRFRTESEYSHKIDPPQSSPRPPPKPSPKRDQASHILFSPDGNYIVAFSSVHGTIQAWNANTGEPTFEYESNITHITFRSTDQKLVTCSRNRVHIWTLEDGPLVAEDLTISSSPVKIIALSPDGLTAIVRDDNRTPSHYMWSTTAYQPLPLTFTNDADISDDKMIYSPSGKFLTGLSFIGVLVWDTQTGELVAILPLFDDRWRANCLAFSPDDSHIALSTGTSIRFWNARTGCLVSGPRDGHTSEITALIFSSDGEKLASSSKGGQIRIWDIWDTTNLFGHPEASLGAYNIMGMHEGWAMNDNKELLFWVPKDHRERLFWPHDLAVIGGNGISTHLDLTSLRYGKDWTDCFGGRT